MTKGITKSAPKQASHELPHCLTFRMGKPEGLPSVDDAIAAHQEIADKMGRVALGKTGKALASSTIERALNTKVPTLVLLTREKDDFHAYSAVIFDVLNKQDCPEDSLLPTREDFY